MARRNPSAKPENIAGLRIIGGRFRGRKLAYSGDLRTRPMKDRVREALFNLLGRAVAGKVAIDLFAGTGALALEALSRGAARAVAVELHRPTARLIVQNAATLGVKSQSTFFAPRTELEGNRAARDECVIEVVSGNTFHWARQRPDLGTTPWVVFCSPPYDFYVDRPSEMLELLTQLIEGAPAESLFAVEADNRFDFAQLPYAAEWDVRTYPPAIVGIWEKEAR